DPTELIMKCIELGIVVSINSRLDFDTMSLLVEDYGYKAVPWAGVREVEEKKVEGFGPRPPIVTILGHVDHGKTTLLDYIRGSNIVAGEIGGITQRIGAYQVDSPYGKMTFIDTPGHYAFASMRARGAQVTDIAVLVVAWDDGVMPQTVEAISHAKASGVPIIVAINKMDIHGANPDKALQQLAEQGLIIEEWGGNTLWVPISAKTGDGVNRLLELIALLAETLELKANPNAKATGVVIESFLDRGRGPCATVLIKDGTLHKGDPIIVGAVPGKVRIMLNERLQEVKEAGPSTPVVIAGLDGLPQAGDKLMVVADEKEAKELAEIRTETTKETLKRAYPITLSTLKARLKENKAKEFNVIVKADSDGTREAVCDLIERLDFEEIKPRVIHAGVGDVNESDVLLAASSNAIILGFAVRTDRVAKQTAQKEGIEIRTYKLIYDLEDDLIAAMEGRLEPIIAETYIGTVEIKNIFRRDDNVTITGCYVQDGMVKRGAIAKLKRGGEIIAVGKVSNLKRYKDDVNEVQQGLECGIAFDGFPELFPDDIVDIYDRIETTRKLKKQQ
ncbi:MAG: translation initiation factor IF-2, partial [bacterium]